MKVNSASERRSQCAKKVDMHDVYTNAMNRKKDTYLYVRFTREADDHEEQDRNDVVVEAGPVIDFERCHEGTYQHEEDRTGSQNRTTC